MHSTIPNIFKFMLISMIKFYKYFISPLLPQSCKFYPSCSSYAEEALHEYGLLIGLYYIAKRIIKCSPFTYGGYDPVIKGTNKCLINKD